MYECMGPQKTRNELLCKTDKHYILRSSRAFVSLRDYYLRDHVGTAKEY